KIFNLTDKEIPHSATCIVENFEKSNNSFIINVAIIVDRTQVKKIIVGSHGSMIKEIGIQARKDIEALLGNKVYLELFVKVIPKWRDKEQYLSEFGYNEFEQDE
ncbi:MAG: KH domain-containing protein, partial [Bacilli bacterium]|nr:KH domain-containing protein [Bacilli bacterium]